MRREGVPEGNGEIRRGRGSAHAERAALSRPRGTGATAATPLSRFFDGATYSRLLLLLLFFFFFCFFFFFFFFFCFCFCFCLRFF
jgi:hypothetical protein